MHFKHSHPRYPTTPLLACRVQRYGCLGRQPGTQTPFYDIVHFKHPHPRYPKTPLPAYRVQKYGCLERHPKTQTPVFGANTPILGIQKHLCWPVGYKGMGAWGATAEPKNRFLALCVSNTPVLGIQKHLFWSIGYCAMGCLSATREPTKFFHTIFSGIVHFKHSHRR